MPCVTRTRSEGLALHLCGPRDDLNGYAGRQAVRPVELHVDASHLPHVEQQIVGALMDAIPGCRDVVCLPSADKASSLNAIGCPSD